MTIQRDVCRAQIFFLRYLLILGLGFEGRRAYVSSNFIALAEHPASRRIFISDFASHQILSINSSICESPTKHMHSHNYEQFSPLTTSSLPRYCYEDDRSLLRLDVSCIDLKPIASPWGLAVSEDVLFVASFSDDVVILLDIWSGRRIDSIGDSDSLDGPSSVAIISSKTQSSQYQDVSVYVANYCSNDIVRFQMHHRQALPVYKPVGLDGISGMYIDSTRRYIVMNSFRSNDILVYRYESNDSEEHWEYIWSLRNSSSTASSQKDLGPMGIAYSYADNAYLISCYHVNFL
jgi:hypothetical protein